jgi:hypothetical protein
MAEEFEQEIIGEAVKALGSYLTLSVFKAAIPSHRFEADSLLSVPSRSFDISSVATITDR